MVICVPVQLCITLVLKYTQKLFQEKSLDNSFRVDSTFVLENFLVIASCRGKRGPAAIFNKRTNNLQEFAINIL